MGRLERQVGGKHRLIDFSSVVSPGDKGVYYIFEPGETRTNSECLRVVRVGTHGLTANSRSTIWTRLFEHLMYNGRSVFRVHVRDALKKRAVDSNQDSNQSRSRQITDYIGNMLFLWVEVDGDDGHVKRNDIERRSIALLSNLNRDPIDEASSCWLGRSAAHHAVKQSGMWNVQLTSHKNYGPEFLSDLAKYIENTNER